MANEVNYFSEDLGLVSATPNAVNDSSTSVPIVTVEGVTMSENQTIAPTGIASAEAWGTAVLTSTVTLSPTGIASAEAWGSPTVTVDQIIAPSGIASAEAWGNPVITSVVVLYPSSIASGEAWGTPELDSIATIIPVGIASQEAWGTPQLRNPGPVRPVTRNTIVVPCRVKACANETSDLQIYNLQDALTFNGTPVTILATCPAGYYCPPGTLPNSFTYPEGTFSVVVPPAGQPFPVVLSATGCESLITRVAPARATAAMLEALANSILAELAQQQARCDARALASPRPVVVPVVPPPPSDCPFSEIVWGAPSTYGSVTGSVLASYFQLTATQGASGPPYSANIQYIGTFTYTGPEFAATLALNLTAIGGMKAIGTFSVDSDVDGSLLLVGIGGEPPVDPTGITNHAFTLPLSVGAVITVTVTLLAGNDDNPGTTGNIAVTGEFCP